jgi:steroid 5-alpha reductase family enzyme
MNGAALVRSAFLAEVGFAVTMSGAWVVQRRTGRSGWVEAIWTFAVGAIGALLALSVNAIGAAIWRAALVAILTATWGLRLGLQIVARTLRAGGDARDRAQIANWGPASPARLFVLLQMQGLTGAVLATSVVLAAKAPDAHWRAQDVFAAVLLVAALFGQALADAQRARFRAEPANRGRVCDVGLWEFMGRPNDVFETLVWLAYPIFAVDPTGGDRLGWLAFAAPAAALWAICRRRPARGSDEPRAPIVFPRIGPRAPERKAAALPRQPQSTRPLAMQSCRWT